jgi:hypothetical protein
MQEMLAMTMRYPSMRSARAALFGLSRRLARTADRMPLRCALLAVLVLEAFVVLAFHPSYESNDDVAMTMIAAGKGISPAPDEHLIFTNVIVGRALSWLYTAAPDVPWYGSYLLLIHCTAQVAILYCTLVLGRLPSPKQGQAGKRLPSSPFTDVACGELEALSCKNVWPRCGLYVLYFTIVEVPLLNVLQFTTTAFLASQAGIFLAVLAWERRARLPDATVVGPCCTAAALLFLGGIVRIESLAMALLVAAPLGILLVRNASRGTLLPIGITLFAAGTAIALAIAYDSRYYECDPQWHGFRGYNQLRGKFHDECWSFYSPETAYVFASAGWSENDHTMITNWFSDDPELYSPAKLHQIVAAYPWKQARQRTNYWRPTFREIVRNPAVLAVMLVLPFVLFVVRGAGARWAILGSVAIALASVAFVAWNKKMPPQRVYFPLLSFPLSVALLVPAWRVKAGARDRNEPIDRGTAPSLGWSPWQIRPWLARGLVVLLIVGVAMGVRLQCRRSAQIQQARSDLRAFLAELRPTGRELYVCWQCAMPFQLISPLDSLHSWAQTPVLAMGWPQKTPYQEAIKRQFAIDSVMRAIFEREDVVSIIAPADCSSIGTFAKEHFEADLEFVALRQTGKHVLVGRFRRREGPATMAAAPSDTTAQ